MTCLARYVFTFPTCPARAGLIVARVAFDLRVHGDVRSMAVRIRLFSSDPPIHDKLQALVSFVESEQAAGAIERLGTLCDGIPDLAVVIENPAVSESLRAVDQARMFGLLGVWKVATLTEASLRTWSDGGLGFDALTAVVTSRAVLEEASRNAYITEIVAGQLQAGDVTLNDSLAKYLSNAEDSGLGDIGLRRAADLAIESLGYGQGVGKNLYSYLSTVSHPEGLSRDVFRLTGFDGAFGLKPRIGKTHLRSAFVAWQSALGLSGWMTLRSWERLETTLKQHIDSADLDLTQGRLQVPPRNYDGSLRRGTPVETFVEGIWYKWRVQGPRTHR